MTVTKRMGMRQQYWKEKYKQKRFHKDHRKWFNQALRSAAVENGKNISTHADMHWLGLGCGKVGTFSGY